MALLKCSSGSWTMKQFLQMLGVAFGLIGLLMCVRTFWVGLLPTSDSQGNAEPFVQILYLILELFFATYPIVTAYLLWRHFSRYAVQRLFVTCILCSALAWQDVTIGLAKIASKLPAMVSITVLAIIMALYIWLPKRLYRLCGESSQVENNPA